MVCERMGKLSLDSCESCQSHACLLFLQPPISFRRKRNGTKKERCPGKFWLYLSLRRENSLDGEDGGESEWVGSLGG